VRSVVLTALVACGNHSPVAPPMSHDSPPPPSADGAPAQAVVLDGNRVAVTVALTEAARERGLMYVHYLAPDDGMLFVFDQDAVLNFWMKNTYIPLDMIFIGSDLTVAGIVADAQPLTLDVRTIGVPSRYVLEVNGGWAAAHHVGAGAKVQFENIP
jgi:uncharacterized membrane protein (UPF0127 family)